MRHKPSIPNRGFRVADQIQRDVAELIRDLKDPRIGMVTIHAVEVTPDYAHATVFFSVLVGDPAAVRAGAERGRRLHPQRPVQAPADPHRADAALQVRPHDRARRRADRADRQGELDARQGRLIVTPTRAARARRSPAAPVHGVLLLDKDAGASSNAALQRAKRLYRAEKAGHTGTLDPLASGLLPLCFGAATKFAQASLDADKRYLATLRLGVTTTTGDLEGEVVRDGADVAIERDALERGLRAVRRRDRAGAADALGAQARRQAALRVRARRHRGRARRRAASASTAIRVVDGDGDLWTIDVSMQQGHLHPHPRRRHRRRARLRRASGGAAPDRERRARPRRGAHAWRSSTALDEAALDARLLPPDALVAAWPRVVLSDERRRALPRRRPAPPRPRRRAGVRVYGPERGAFLGTGHVVGGELIASRLLSPAEVGDLVAAQRQPSSVSESLSA